ncbi:MAG: hypothetical protein H0X42_02195 [Solirubrobacterales bacterium]|nr:hypothetical protein [Solirubrobacterales bacterium]
MRRKDRSLQRDALEAETSQRLAQIVAAAELSAKQVIDDAEAEGRRFLGRAEAEADRIVAERLALLVAAAEALAARVEAIGRESEQLLEQLKAIRVGLGEGASLDPGAVEPERGARPHLSAVAPVEAASEEAATQSGSEGEDRTPAGARLLATQMAVLGSSREEIDARLKKGFEIEDTGAIMDAILGPEE